MDSVKGILSLGYLVAIVLGIIGWFMNLFAFFQCDFEGPWKEEIIRGIGIVTGLVGAIAGWMTF